LEVAIVGLDIAKNVFQLHGTDRQGRVALHRKLRRESVARFFANLPKFPVGLEACGGAISLGTKAERDGAHGPLACAQFVKPFVKSNKNDAKDAEDFLQLYTITS
jgi:transposase